MPYLFFKLLFRLSGSFVFKKKNFTIFLIYQCRLIEFYSQRTCLTFFNCFTMLGQIITKNAERNISVFADIILLTVVHPFFTHFISD